MKKIGIDAIGFYTSHYYLDLKILAEARHVDANKFHHGLGQFKMGVASPDEDIVTMAANAAEHLLPDVDVKEIDTLLFATESAFDQSKCAGIYVHKLLGLPQRCRIVELKQACYGGTGALQLAIAWVYQNPAKKVLIIASDISRYGLNTSGESSQGCGAVAMLISANPRLITIEPGSGLYTDDVMDFWRPNYCDTAIVEGKYSAIVYIRSLEEAWKHYQEETQHTLEDIDYFCYHTPVPRLVEKAHKQLLKINGIRNLDEETIQQRLKETLEYSRITGNSYTASLYVGLVSLLDNCKKDLSNKRIGFYSYGSGCMAEYFSGVVEPTYRKMLDTAAHKKMLKSRHPLTYDDYVELYSFHLPIDGSECDTPHYETGFYRLNSMKNHQRKYEKVKPSKRKKKIVEKSEIASVRAVSPGKLIITGEHSVVYGKPAIVMAVDRFAEASISPQISELISFSLLSSRYKDSFTIQTLREIKNRLCQKYQNFLDGQCGIREVLQTPFELAQFTAVNFFEHLNARIIRGFNLSTASTIPVNCGMGSSAAAILSIIQVIAKFFKLNVPAEKILRYALESENLQHGISSGIDIHVSFEGGCLHYRDGKIEKRPIPTIPMYLINTGARQGNTGDCVTRVAEHFGQSNIWNDFESIAANIDRALQQHDGMELRRLIKENHRLLVDIQVVPNKVQQCIQELEQAGGAAKICGAGAVMGDSAGAILALADHEKVIKPICDRYGYELSQVHCESQGLHVA